MGVRNYWVEGVSGAGKTTLAEELERRGYDVLHGDRQFAYHGDPDSGAPLDWPRHLGEAERIAWGYAHWIWPVERVKARLADHRHPVTFFCGGARNAHHFVDLFGAVFVLEVDAATLRRRLARRGDDEFGGRPLERDLVLRLNASGEGLPAHAIRIDASGPPVRIADDILARCAAPG